MRFFPEQHLDSPIMDTYLELYRSRAAELIQLVMSPTPVPFRHAVPRPSGPATQWKGLYSIYGVLEKARVVCSAPLSAFSVIDPIDYPVWFRTPTANRVKVLGSLSWCEDTCRPLINQVLAGLSKLAGVDQEMAPRVLIPYRCSELAPIEEFYSIMIETYIEKRSSGYPDPISVCTDDLAAVVSQSIVMVEAKNQKVPPTVMTYHQLLMLRDAVSMRKNVFLACHHVYPADPLLPSLIDSQLLWQESCILEYGNEGYELVKSTEALSKTWLVRLTGDYFAGPDDAYDRMRQKIDKKEESIAIGQKKPWPPQETVSESYEQTVLRFATRIEQVVELFGLQKLSGHPVVDPRSGGIKSASKAREKDTTSSTAAVRLRNTFARLLCQGFIAKERRWPPLIFLKTGLRVQELYESKDLNLSRHRCPASDWSFVRFKKFAEFNKYDDFFPLIDDKALGFYRDSIASPWTGAEPSSSRRLLLELLSREDFSVEEIIETVEDLAIPDNWKVISLYPKEREFKLAPRMFSLMPLEVRMFFAAVEGTIAEVIIPYFPQITMTSSKHDVAKRFLSLTRPLRNDDTIRVMIELDLSSWNLMWRQTTIGRIGADLNDAFGMTRAFTTLHPFFEECLIHVRIPALEPTGITEDVPPESDLLWYDHKGGFEGIGQKTWSIATVAMIEVALEDTPYHYEITDQGDNVVLTVSTARDFNLDIRQQLRAVEDDAVKRCTESAAAIHQEIKGEECVSFTKVITYSKTFYVDGSEYYTTLKFLSRPFPSAAADFPSYAAMIQGIFSACYAAADSCKRPEVCYFLALLHACTFISRTGEFFGAYRDIYRLSPGLRTMENIRLQLLWPSELGGLPVVGAFSFLYKGGGDPLTKSLSSLVMIQEWSVEARQILAVALTDQLYSANPDIESLVMDPFGLPVRKPRSPETAVAEESLVALKTICKNRDISHVLSLATDEYREAFFSNVKTWVPFNPVIVHSVWNASILGAEHAVSNAFLKTRTLQGIARKDAGINIVEDFIDAGSMQIAFVISLLRSVSRREHIVRDLFEFANELRGRWAPCGVVPTDITSYSPIQFKMIWAHFDQTTE